MKRLATIQAPMDLGATGTRVMDIDAQGQISAIDIRWRCTNVTVSVMLNWIFACISKIEVVDGSKVLASLSSAELFALDYYNNGKLPHYYAGMAVGAPFEFAARLNFGRYLWDKEFALRPEMYNNLQLRVTWDEDACNTGVVVNSFAAYAHVDDTPADGGAYGFLLTKEVKTFAMAGAAHEYTKLPVDGDHRLTMVYGYSADHDVSDLIDNFKLDMNSGSTVIHDQSVEDNIILSDKIAVEQIVGCGDEVVTAKDIYSCFGEKNRLTIEYDATAHVTAQTLFALGIYTGPFCNMAASVDIQADFYKVQGSVPGCCVPIFHGDPSDPESWMKVSTSDELRADILGLAASDNGDTCAIVTQQLVRY